MQLRDYQLRIVNKIAGKNALVMLPTGSGKTLIFAELIRRALSLSSLAPGKHSASSHLTKEGRKVLFLVPTQLLVKQQAKTFRAFAPNLTVGEYMGGLRLPSTFDVLVSTPKSFQNAQEKEEASLAWANFCLIGFDEVHHALKDHPYRTIALEVPHSGPKVVGLTASLTYAVEKKKMEAAVKRTIRDMRIEVIEIATPQELEASGCHATRTPTQVIEEIDILEEAESGEDSETGAPEETNRPVSKNERKPNPIEEIFSARQAKKQETTFATLMGEIVQHLETRVTALDPGFSSPREPKFKVKMTEWAAYVKKRKDACSERKDSACYHDALQAWYDALRIFLVSKDTDEELPVIWLRLTGQLPCVVSGEAKMKPYDDAPLAHLIEQFNQRYNAKQLRRCATLEQVLLQRAEEVKNSPLRGIVFVQQRITAHIIDYFVRTSPKLAKAGFVSAPLYAVGTPASADFSISKSDSARTISAFRDGRVNLLVSTAVAEEGMDVPEANCVVRFDPVLHSVSFVQGRGRARQEGARQVVLREHANRPVTLLENVEEQQQRIISGLQSTLTSSSFFVDTVDASDM